MLKKLNYSLSDSHTQANIENFVRTATFIRPMGSHPSFPSCGQDKEACRFIDTYKNNLSAFQKHIRATCEEIIISCMYNGKEFNCCENFVTIDTFDGKCFAFNNINAIYEEDFLQWKPPYGDKSIQKDLNKLFNAYDYIKYKIEHKFDKNPANLSVELNHADLYVWYLGNTYFPTKMFQKDNQFALMDLNDRFLDVYLQVQEIIPDQSVFGLELERRNCRFYYEIEMMRFLKTYSISGCEVECLIKAQLLYCGCVLHMLPNQNGLKEKQCNTTGILCTATRIEIVKYLSHNCSCISTCFYLEVFPVGFVKNDESRENESFRNTRSTRRLNFLVRAPTVRHWIQPEHGSLDFIVNIGGAISLCIGCSFLSLAQLFYYFLLKPFNDFVLKKKEAKVLKKRSDINKMILRQKRKIITKKVETNIRKQATLKRATLLHD